jgi:hypothetical protein
MKLRSLLVVLVVAASASAAVAAPPQGKGKPSTGQDAPSTGESTTGKPSKTGPGCRPRVSLILKGVLVDAPGAAGTSISVNVASANHHGALFTKGSQPVKITVGPTTVVRRQGKKTLADLVSGDRVLVQARACKADLVGTTAVTDGSTAQLVATRIVAHPGASSSSSTSASSS